MAVDLKSEEEVTEYLKNLQIEYKFACHSEKDPGACHLLGDFQEAIKKDFALAGQTYKDNCDERNFATSCRKFGGYALIGKGLDKESPAEAYTYMKKGCDLGDHVSCANAGILGTTIHKNENKEEGPLDFSTGMEMLNKSCNEHKLEKACYYLSGIYLSGVPGIMEKNMLEAYKTSLKACEFGNAYACANVSQMHARGEGVEKNSELAEAFKQRALAIQKSVKESKHIQFQQGLSS